MWYMHTYGLAPTDERYHRANRYQMEDAWHSRKAYNRLLKGEPLEDVYESEKTEQDLFDELDTLGAREEVPETSDEEWVDVPPGEGTLDLIREEAKAALTHS